MRAISGDLLTTGDVARALGLSPEYVRVLLKAGRLPAARTRSGRWVVTAEAVEQLRQQREAERSARKAAARAVR
ncbi:MAG: helix-turn-helix domain-containing protein [Armatimonadota bacterium]|nr:helix-turn-helix domain-containing protein [Armatimonadota bacterium]